MFFSSLAPFMVLVICLLTYAFVVLVTPYYARVQKNAGHVVKDVNKKIETFIPRPVSLPILLGVLLSQSLIYLFLGIEQSLVLYLITIMAYIVGFVDDVKIMKGWFKPVMLMPCVIPIILSGYYDSSLVFPFIGTVNMPFIIYLIPLTLYIPVIANTVNSIDVVNGSMTGVMIIVSVGITSILSFTNVELLYVALPLLFVSVAYYHFHSYPSSVFPGDSGALVFGTTFAVIAIMGNLEVFAVIMLTPLILNSFLYLASVKRFSEHRELKNPPVIHDDKFNLMDSKNKNTAMTLVRLLVRKKPLSERTISLLIVFLTVISTSLSLVLATFNYDIIII